MQDGRVEEAWKRWDTRARKLGSGMEWDGMRGMGDSWRAGDG